MIIFNGSTKRFIHFFLEKNSYSQQANLDPQKCSIFKKDQSERERERESKINVNINQNKTMNLILNLCSSNRIAFPGKNCKLQKVHFFISRFYIESLTIMYISNPRCKNIIFQRPHLWSQKLRKNNFYVDYFQWGRNFKGGLI